MAKRIALILSTLLLTCSFSLSVFADSKSVSVSAGYLDLVPSMISSFESTSNLDMFNGSNSYGDYFSVFASDPSDNLGDATFNLYGSDLSLYPPDYSYNKVEIAFVCSASWTQVADMFREDNYLEITFGINGYASRSITLDQVSDLRSQPIAIGIELSLIDFQQIGFGQRGFYVSLYMPNHSQQVVLYDPQISWFYGRSAVNPTPTPPPTPTPTPIFPNVPNVTPPPPDLEIWDSLLPIDDDAFLFVHDLIAIFFDTPYIGGLVRLSIFLGFVAIIFGLSLSVAQDSVKSDRRRNDLPKADRNRNSKFKPVHYKNYKRKSGSKRGG